MPGEKVVLTYEADPVSLADALSKTREAAQEIERMFREAGWAMNQAVAPAIAAMADDAKKTTEDIKRYLDDYRAKLKEVSSDEDAILTRARERAGGTGGGSAPVQDATSDAKRAEITGSLDTASVHLKKTVNALGLTAAASLSVYAAMQEIVAAYTGLKAETFQAARMAYGAGIGPTGMPGEAAAIVEGTERLRSRYAYSREELYQTGAAITGTGLYQQGMWAEGGLVEQVQGLSARLALTPQQITGLMQGMEMLTQEPIERVSQNFYGLATSAADARMGIERYAKNVFQLERMTVAYGVTMQESQQFVTHFARKIDQGIISVQSLAKAMAPKAPHEGLSALLSTPGFVESLPAHMRAVFETVGQGPAGVIGVTGAARTMFEAGGQTGRETREAFIEAITRTIVPGMTGVAPMSTTDFEAWSKKMARGESVVGMDAQAYQATEVAMRMMRQMGLLPDDSTKEAMIAIRKAQEEWLDTGRITSKAHTSFEHRTSASFKSFDETVKAGLDLVQGSRTFQDWFKVSWEMMWRQIYLDVSYLIAQWKEILLIDTEATEKWAADPGIQGMARAIYSEKMAGAPGGAFAGLYDSPAVRAALGEMPALERRQAIESAVAKSLEPEGMPSSRVHVIGNIIDSMRQGGGPSLDQLRYKEDWLAFHQMAPGMLKGMGEDQLRARETAAGVRVDLTNMKVYMTKTGEELPEYVGKAVTRALKDKQLPTSQGGQ